MAVNNLGRGQRLRKVVPGGYGPSNLGRGQRLLNVGPDGKLLNPAAAVPSVSTPAAPVPPPAGAGGGEAPAPPKPPTPFDSTFSTGVQGLMTRNRNQRDDLGTQGAQATEDFNTMLSRMAESRAKDLVATNEGANREGLFYSGQLGKRRGQVEQGYSQKEGDARTAFNRATEARLSALERLGTLSADAGSPTGLSGTGQAGLDLADLLNQAVIRRDAANAPAADLAAALGLGPANTPAAAAPAAEAVPQITSAGAQPTTGGPAVKVARSAAHGGAMWVYHRAASGQWIPIRPA